MNTIEQIEAALVDFAALDAFNAPVRKKRPKTKPRSKADANKRKRYAKVHNMAHLNVRLLDEEADTLALVAKRLHIRKTLIAYSAILDYLKNCAEKHDLNTVLDPKRTIADDHWGTPDEVLNPRIPPKHFRSHHAEREERRRLKHGTIVSQQYVTAVALEHIHAIARYYRVAVEDLVGSAIDYAFNRL